MCGHAPVRLTTSIPRKARHRSRSQGPSSCRPPELLVDTVAPDPDRGTCKAARSGNSAAASEQGEQGSKICSPNRCDAFECVTIPPAFYPHVHSCQRPRFARWLPRRVAGFGQTVANAAFLVRSECLHVAQVFLLPMFPCSPNCDAFECGNDTIQCYTNPPAFYPHAREQGSKGARRGLSASGFGGCLTVPSRAASAAGRGCRNAGRGPCCSSP